MLQTKVDASMLAACQKPHQGPLIFRGNFLQRASTATAEARHPSSLHQEQHGWQRPCLCVITGSALGTVLGLHLHRLRRLPVSDSTGKLLSLPRRALVTASREQARNKVEKMSALTLQLIAADIIRQTEHAMEEMPTSWAASLDEKGQLRRHERTMSYLKSCYTQAMEALPEELSESEHDVMEKLLSTLVERCEEGAEFLHPLLGFRESELLTVPKYYYSELRSIRGCSLPPPPKVFIPEAFLAFLAVEAVANLRNVQRFGILAERKESKLAETWMQLQDRARSAARLLVVAMLKVYGEEVASAEIEACIKPERTVVLDVFSMRTGLTAADDDDDDEEEYCLIQKPVFVVSDCTGESAERTVNAALGQFGHCFDRSMPLSISTYRFCTEEGHILPVVEKAAEDEALIVFTLVDPIMNAAMVEACAKHGVDYLDLWSPLLNKLEAYFQTARLGIPGRRQAATDNYMELIECIEYTRTLDDGVDPKRWLEADLMIVGPSRSGKTPLSFFMAQRGFKVANYPLVPDEDPPEELWQLPQDRVFALTINANKLLGIRNTRMKALKMGSKSSYAKLDNIKGELEWCRRLYMSNPKWQVIDTTDTGIEEICARILQVLQDRSNVTPRFVADSPSAI